MGLFGRRQYVHVNRDDRGVIETRQENFRDWIPSFDCNSHFSVFGGSVDRRNLMVLEAISRCYGKMGIIVIHSNPSIISMIDGFYQYYPRLCNHTEEMGIDVKKCQISSAQPEYEPFYGMSGIRVIEAIYPQLYSGNLNAAQKNLCEEALKQFFKIIRFLGEELDLDILIKLVNMDINEIEDIISGMSQNERSTIISTLINNNIFIQVRADLNAFASRLEGRIWTRSKDDEEVSDISMIKAVENNAILSIHVNSNRDILNYLAAEIKVIMDSGRRFLLVLDSVNIESTVMNDELMNLLSLPFSTVLASDNIRGIFGNSNFENALSRMNVALLLRHANINVAREYSNAIGQYDRQMVTYNYGSNREAFKIFGSHNKGQNVMVDRFDRISPEEIVGIGDGAIIMDQENNEIIKTSNLIM